MIVLDPRDEVPDENGYKWYHISTMTETRKCTFSFMCRLVNKTVCVDAKTSIIIAPQLSKKFEKRLNQGDWALKKENYQL